MIWYYIISVLMPTFYLQSTLLLLKYFQSPFRYIRVLCEVCLLKATGLAKFQHAFT